MIKFQYILFDSEHSFKYRLKEDVTYNIQCDFGKWRLIDPISGLVVVNCQNHIITVHEGYMWDGSTVVGNYYEDYETMEASLLHDVLYNAKKNPDEIEVNFSLFEADKIFAKHLEYLYKNNDSFFKRKLFPWIYYLGLITIGLPWKCGKNEYYKLKKA